MKFLLLEVKKFTSYLISGKSCGKFKAGLRHSPFVLPNKGNSEYPGLRGMAGNKVHKTIKYLFHCIFLIE
jgi:hypothetical protein